MKHVAFSTAAFVAALALQSSPASAQSLVSAHPANSTNPAGIEPFKGDRIYKAFHEKEGVQRIIDDFVPRIASDPRIKDHFATTNLPRLNLLLVQQICYLTGGPCEYTGRDMRTTHASLGISKADFNALAEDLRLSMDKEKVNFHAQNQLLAKLAPQERVIVTK